VSAQPFVEGDKVRYLVDPDHIEVVDACRRPEWHVQTSWDGHTRSALADEFELVEPVDGRWPWWACNLVIVALKLTAWALVLAGAALIEGGAP